MLLRIGALTGLFVGAASVVLPDLPAQQPPSNPADYAPAYQLSSGKADKNRRALGIIAEPRGALDPCSREDGPNFVNFVSRGRSSGEDTYLYGVDLCTRRPFVYREPTQPGVITGFDANPPSLTWALDPEDSRNLRGDRFPVEILVGIEGVFSNASVDFGLTADRNPDASLAPYVGVRFSRVRLTFSRAAFPNRDTWLAKVAFAPFRKGAGDSGPLPGPVPEARPGEVTYYEPVSELCNASAMGVRGVDRLRVGERQDEGFPVTLEMVSYCADEYEHYLVRTRTDRAYFSQFNNTFPQFANWGDIPRGGLLSNLAVVTGYGQIDHDLGSSNIKTNVLYLGIGISFGDSRWRFDAGRLFPLERFLLSNDPAPIALEVNGWTAGVQRALSIGL